MAESALPPDDLRCKRTDGRYWRCKRPVEEGKSFCLSHLYRRQKHHIQSSNPNPEPLLPPPDPNPEPRLPPPNPNPKPQLPPPDPKPKPRLRIRVRVKPEPTEEFEFNPPPEPQNPGPPEQPGTKPGLVTVPDHLRCHRNDGRSWRCKKEVLEGQTLCDIHFKKAKAQNQRRPTMRKMKKEVAGPSKSPKVTVVVPENLRCKRCKKRVVEGQSLCEMHLKKVSNSKIVNKNENVGGGGDGVTIAAIPDAVVSPLGSDSLSFLPPDHMRCTRNDGRDWRCKQRVMEGETLCVAHFKKTKLKMKDFVGGEEEKKKKVTKKRKKVDDNVLIKVKNEEGVENGVQGAVVALPASRRGVVRSEKPKRKSSVVVEEGVVRSENTKRKKSVVGEGVVSERKSSSVAVANPDDDEFRCKRTDGRGWRCKRRVMEGKTLCELHYEQGRLRQLKITVPEELKIQRGVVRSEKAEKKLKRKRELEILENNSDKGMKQIRAELIRVFLRREIIESTKKTEKRGEEAGEVIRELPFGSMAIPPAPTSQILGNAESLGFKIGAPCSNSLGNRRFRSKNIEPTPIGTVKVVFLGWW